MILQLLSGLDQCLPNVSDPNRNGINAGTLWGPAEKHHTHKPCQDVHDPGFGQDGGSSPISLVLSVAFQMNAIIYPVSYQAPSSLQLASASLSALPKAVLLQPLSSSRRAETSCSQAIPASRSCHCRTNNALLPSCCSIQHRSEKVSLEPDAATRLLHCTENPRFVLFLILWLPISNTRSCSCSPLCSPCFPFGCCLSSHSLASPCCFCSVCGHQTQLWVSDLRSIPAFHCSGCIYVYLLYIVFLSLLQPSLGLFFIRLLLFYPVVLTVSYPKQPAITLSNKGSKCLV